MVQTVGKRKRKLSLKVTKRRDIRSRLGHMTVRQAARLLDPKGAEQLRLASKIEIDAAEHIKILGDTLIARVPDRSLASGWARVTLVEKTSRADGLQLSCDACSDKCLHIAATLQCVLESKMVLGLSTEPDPDEPIENLTESELIERAIADRKKRATTERMVIESLNRKTPWTEYTVTSQESGRSYHVSLRGEAPGDSACTCPDFRTNQLGVCKHIFHVLDAVKKQFKPKALATSPRPKELSLRMHYGHPDDPQVGLRFVLPDDVDRHVVKLVGHYQQQTLTDPKLSLKIVRALERNGTPVQVHPDAETYIHTRSMQQRLAEQSAEIRKSPKDHPLRTSLLKVPLLPYQMDGIAFAVGAGRAILADDMGLGKTIQGIGTAELLGRLTDIRNVLVVCPASLKSQWASEIARFCDRSHRIVMGTAEERAEQYADEAFFKIANYEQIVRDEAVVQNIDWDLIILDEGQRIKNWESKTSRTFQMLKSKYALVLSGTPLENRLEELYTVAKFIDSKRLGPAYRFFHKHRSVDDSGRVVGYKRLEELRATLAPMLLRRTRASVMQELPERTTEIVRIRPTDEQRTMSNEHVANAARIAAKPYLTEIDMLRLQKHLLCARMAANSTFLVDKQEPAYSSKLEVMEELLEQLADEPSRKIVIFSEWTKMLDLIEPLLNKHGIDFVRLEGKIPQKQRQAIVHRFQKDPTCRAIIMSNAGATGLNLQAANTVINVDLPWNPAVLEQRIARAHRMGQKRPVHVFILVTEQTIEERLLETLAAKSELAHAALDFDSDISEVSMSSGAESLKKRLEKLLGEKPIATVDESQRQEAEQSAQLTAERRAKVAAAGGELLGAALNLVSQLLDQGNPPEPTLVQAMSTNLQSCVDRDEQGRPQLRLTLPDDQSLQSLAKTLAQLLVAQGK
ncbi:MAG: DEAD/DEAH box helicase [Pirellula sp.]|jgi:superfamily II DNA or RNA helicase|nr:DEAD/DEAH box helicase [Pirellula sp.]